MNTNARFVGWYGKGKWGIVACCLENIGQHRRIHTHIHINIYVYRIANIGEWNWRNWPRRMNDTWTTLEHRFGKEKGQSRGTQRALIRYTWSCVSEPRYPGVFHAWFKCDPFWIRDRWHRLVFPLIRFFCLFVCFRIEFDFINIIFTRQRISLSRREK